MSNHRISTALVASAVFLLPICAVGQPAPNAAPSSAAALPPAVVQAPTLVAPAPVAPTILRLPEGTEVDLTLNDTLSSATAAEGDKFSITTADPIKLTDGTVIPAGYRGRGEVSAVEKRGMMGKAGQLSVRLDYVMLGDTKVHLRANKSQEGKSTQSTTIVLSLLISPLFLLMHGKDATIPKGQAIVGYVDSDVQIASPVAAPPMEH
jgi:hypothetical protein